MFLKIKVFPGSKSDGIVKKREDTFEIRVKEKPERGEANRKAVSLIAEHLEIDEKKIRIIKGHHERSKILMVDDCSKGL
ncbi:MAG: DUF167 domain-containing protein [Deltaproteobacteria bacterium]|nr:DUF167 domain-containing protein [Deltaproteobacteria bacterium]